MRLTVRGVLVNSLDDKILLIRYIDSVSESTKDFKQGFWVLVGGGVEQGETFEAALQREIFEETGLQNLDIGNCVMSRCGTLNLASMKDNYNYERYYLVHTTDTSISADNLEPLEVENIQEYRWWSVDEIKNTNEVVFPPLLAQHIDMILTNPEQPIDFTDTAKLVLGQM